MTESELRRIYNVAWLIGQGVRRDSDFILQESSPLPAEAIAFRSRIESPITRDPLKEWDWRSIPPLNASSWLDCSNDDLVECGWFGDGISSNRFWGIRLTKEGRSEIAKAAD